MSVIIRLQKLPWTANATNIRRFFYGMSIPDGGVHIIGGELGDAFIAFSSDEDARKAMQLTGSRLNEAAVTLQLSSKNEMQTVIAAARGGIAPKVAEPAPASTPSYPATEMSPSANTYRDQRDGGPPGGLGQQPHRNVTPSQPDGRMQRPGDDPSTFVNSPRKPNMPDFMQQPPQQAFFRPDQERETRDPTDGRRPDFGRHPQPMQHDGPRFREEPERDIRRRPDQPSFDRRHGGDARGMGMEGRPPRDQSRFDQEKRDMGREHGQNFASPISADNKPRHDVANNSSGNNSGYDGGPRPMDRNFPGFQRDFNYERVDPTKQGVPTMNKRDVPPQVPNEGRPGRDQAGFMKDPQRIPAGPSPFDTDGRPTMRGPPRPEQSGEFGRPMHMNDTVSPRFNRGEGMQRDDRSFDGPGREPVHSGSRLQGVPPRNAFPQGPNSAPGPVGPDSRNMEHDRRDTHAISKDVDFHSGPGQMQGPPGSSGPRRPGTEFDGRPREMQQQSNAQPREPAFFGRGRPEEETPKFQDGQQDMFEQDGRSVRNGARFDRGGPPIDVVGQGPGMGGRGNDFNAPFPQIGNAMARGFGRGSPQMGRGRFPPNAEGYGVGRGGPFRDSGRADIFPDGPMADTESTGAGRGGFRRDANASGFGRGGMPREPDAPDFNKTGAPRDAEMPAFGRGGPNRDPNANIGRRGPPGEPPQGRYDAAFKGEMPGFEPGRQPSELGRREFGRGGPPLDLGMRPPRDFEGPRFGSDVQDLDSRDMDVDRPEIGRDPIDVEEQRFGRGVRNVNVGGHGDAVGPGFERRGPRMEMGGPGRYVDQPGFQNVDESRFGGPRPPINIDGPGFGMGGPRQDNDRRDVDRDQGRYETEIDGRHFIDRREGPHDGRPQHNEQMYHRHDAQRDDEPMSVGMHIEGHPRQNARPSIKPGLLGDAPGDMIINSGANPTMSIPNLFDEPTVDRWHQTPAEDRDRRRERDYERKDSSPRGPSSQYGYHHDEEFRRHDRKRPRGGGDADTCCVHVSGFSRSYNFRDVRRLFRGCDVPRDGLKMTNDSRGHRVGECFMRFLAPSQAEEALSRDGIVVEGRTLHVRCCSEYDFDKSIDSYLPGISDDHGPRSVVKRPRSRSPPTRQHAEAEKTDTYLAVKNLPHKVTKTDLKKFFGALRLLDQSVHIENHKETSSAYVKMASQRDYPAALNLDKRTLNSRTINIFPISAREFQAQVVSLKGSEGENVVDVVQKVEPKLEVKKKAPVIDNATADRSVKQQEKKTVTPAKQPSAPVANSTCVKMTGLPSTANGAMVKTFFAGLQLATRGINIIYNKDQTATGIAFVEFASAPECENALKKNRTSMNDSSCVFLETIDKAAMLTQMTVENARCRGTVPETKKAPLIPTLTPRTMPEQRILQQPKPAQRMPEQRIPQQPKPVQRMTEQRIPQQAKPAQRMPEQLMPAQRMQEQRLQQEQRMPEQRMPEQRMPEQRLQEKQMPEQPLQEQQPAQEQRQGFAIRVRNAPFRATERDMHGFFMCCGPVPGSVNIQRAPNGMPTGDVLIAFHNPADARRAVTDLHGRFLMGRSLMLSLV